MAGKGTTAFLPLFFKHIDEDACTEAIPEVSLCYILAGYRFLMHILYTLNLDIQKAFD